MESLQQYFEQKKNSTNRIHVRDAGVIYKKKLCKLADSDFETIFDQLVSQESEQPGERTLTFEEFCYYFSCLNEIEEKTYKPFSTYLNNLHDFVKVKDSKLEQDRKNHAGGLDIIDTQFSDVCPKYFFDSLQRTKALGEFEYIQKLNAGVQKYVYNHRVENNINLPVRELGDLYHLKFLYYIWNFQWEKALNILKEYLIKQKEYEEALSILPVFEDFAEVAQCIKENSTLKEIFCFRKGEEIRYNRQNMQHRKVYEKFQSSIQLMEEMVEIITHQTKILRITLSLQKGLKSQYSLQICFYNIKNLCKEQKS